MNNSLYIGGGAPGGGPLGGAGCIPNPLGGAPGGGPLGGVGIPIPGGGPLGGGPLGLLPGGGPIGWPNGGPWTILEFLAIKSLIFFS